MKFEGSEKKLEMITHPQSQSFRGYPFSFFKSLLKKSNTKIIDQFSNSYCTSYILSESSLFVWDHRLILITCGKTTLADSVLYLINHTNKKDIQALFFQRKNEFFPLDQKSNFFNDIRRFKKKINGQALQFGNLDEHHFFLFYLDQEFFPSKEDQTVEILMYGLKGNLAQIFNTPSSIDQIRKALNLNQCFLGFTIQDYKFHPNGYSVNALNGKKYFTIHVTPQKLGFYVSFETNINDHPKFIIQKILLLFKPRSFDVIIFTPVSQSFTFNEDIFDYFRTAFYKKRLQCGFDIEFLSFNTIQNQYQNAFTIEG